MRLLLSLAMAGLTWLPAHGSILGSNNLSIDFTDPKDAAAKADWSTDSGKLTITAGGLGWEAEAATRQDGWIHTKPLAVGLSWRPATSVSIQAAITPLPDPILLNNGQTSTPYDGNLYARYSPDGKHWSNWQELKRSNDPASARVFTGTLGVPDLVRGEYLGLLEAYSKLDVPWVDDQEGLALWIVSRDPTFFARSLPFIGYVEFLFEAPFYGGQRIKALKADVGFGLSGLHRKAKDPAVETNRDGPWRYKAE